MSKRKIYCSADALLNPSRSEHNFFEAEIVTNIAKDLEENPFVRISTKSGAKNFFGKQKFHGEPVWLDLEAAKSLRRDLDRLIEEMEGS